MKSKRLAERKLKKQIEQTYAGGFPHFEGGFYVATQLKNGYLYDKENRKILDCDNRDGSVLFDRQEKQFSKALKNMFKSGIPFSSPSHLEIEYGNEISKHLHYHDRLRLTETRNDALRLCARLACAYTERSTVIFFGDAPPARSMKDTWIPMSASNLPDAVRLLQQSENKIAAVIINPLLTDDHDILEGSENLKDFVGNIVADGALLVIDEHYTGFRLSSRGFAGRYYLQPDLTVYSGIACGGLPGGILAA
ncbi:MAG: hypothetical protein KDK38_10120, partial [Leptospiraceae bacterium]|nr:hypothetical protein [Leptospiraceae bacterium]